MAKSRYSFVLLMSATIVVLALYVHRHRQGQTGQIDNFLISSLGTVQSQSQYLGRGFRRVLDHYFFLVGVQRRNSLLLAEVSKLQSEIASLGEVRSENERLRKVLDFQSQQPHARLTAHVISHDVSPDYISIRIDRGSNEGIRVGLGIVSPDGVVGRVHRVAREYSDVITVWDPESSIDVIVQRSRARGILSGAVRGLECDLRYSDKLDDVQVGDLVVASGFGDIFPKGLLVGSVIQVLPNPSGVLQTVRVQSAVDIYRLEEVSVVIPPAESKKAS